MKKGMGLLTFGLSIVLTVGSARAGFVVYTDRTTFEAALKSETTETFNELGPNIRAYSPNLTQADGLTQPLTITGSGNYLLSGSASSLAGYHPSNGTYLLGGIGSSASDGITVTFAPNSMNAAGADVSNYTVDGPVSFTGTTTLGETFSGMVQVAGSNKNSPFGFLGVTTSPNDFITSIRFSATVGSNVNVLVDNVSFGTPIPEPASIALFGSGVLLVGMNVLVRRIRRAKV